MADNFSDRKLIGLHSLSDRLRGVTVAGGSSKHAGFIPMLDEHGMLDASIVPGEVGNVARQLAEEVEAREAGDEALGRSLSAHTGNTSNPHGVKASQLVPDSGSESTADRVMRFVAERLVLVSTSYDSNDRPVVSTYDVVTTANVARIVEETIENVLAGVMLLKGYVATKTDLPSTAREGDVYGTNDTALFYLFDGTAWKALGGGEDALTRTEAAETYLKLSGGTVTGSIVEKTTVVDSVSGYWVHGIRKYLSSWDSYLHLAVEYAEKVFPSDSVEPYKAGDRLKAYLVFGGTESEAPTENVSAVLFELVVTSASGDESRGPAHQTIEAEGSYGNIRYTVVRTPDTTGQTAGTVSVRTTGYEDDRERITYEFSPSSEYHGAGSGSGIDFRFSNSKLVSLALCDYRYLPIASFEKFNDSLQSTLDAMQTNIAEIAARTETDPVFTAWKGSARIAAGAGAYATTTTANYGSVALGAAAHATADKAVALGSMAEAKADDSAQIGDGTNTEAKTLKFRSTKIVDSDGKIPGDSVKNVLPAAATSSGYNIGSVSLSHGSSVAFGYDSHAEGSGNSAIGGSSHAEGGGCSSIGSNSHAEGCESKSIGSFSHVDGFRAVSAESGYDGSSESDFTNPHIFAYVWQGAHSSNTAYHSHGNGTFNINPISGIDGFWVGEQTLRQVISSIVSSSLAGYLQLSGGTLTGSIYNGSVAETNKYLVKSEITTLIESYFNQCAKLSGAEFTGDVSVDGELSASYLKVPSATAAGTFVSVATLEDLAALTETDPVFTAWRDGQTIRAGAGSVAQTGAVVLGQNAKTPPGAGSSVAIGNGAEAQSADTTAVGRASIANGRTSTAIGYHAKTYASNAVQIGAGTNQTANTVQVGGYQLVNIAPSGDGAGKIFVDRLPDSVVLLNSSGRIDSAILPTTVVQTNSDGRIENAVIPSSVVQTNSAGRIEAAVIPSSVVQTNASGRIEEAVLPANVVRTNASGFIETAILPPAVVQADSDGRIRANALPLSVVQTNGSGKIQSSMLPPSAVLTDSNGKISSDVLPSSVIKLDADGHIPTSVLPASIPSYNLPANIAYTNASGRLPSSVLPTSVVYKTNGRIPVSELPASAMVWPSGHSSVLPSSMLPNNIVYLDGVVLPSALLPSGVLFANAIASQYLPQNIVYANSSGRIGVTALPPSAVVVSGPDLRIPSSVLPANVLRANSNGYLPSSAVPPNVVKATDGVLDRTIYMASGNPYVDNDTLVRHTEDTNNPHSVTASQVGAYSVEEVDKLLSNKTGLVGETVFRQSQSDDTSSFTDSIDVVNDANVYALVRTPDKYSQEVSFGISEALSNKARRFVCTVESLVHSSLSVRLYATTSSENLVFVGDSEIDVPNNKLLVLEVNEVAPRTIVIDKKLADMGQTVTIQGTSVSNSDLEGLNLQGANVILPNATSIAAGAFVNTGIRSVQAPKLRSVGANAFFGCSSLLCVIAGCAQTIGSDALAGCSSLMYFSPFSSVEKTSNDQYVFDDGSSQTVVTGVSPSDVEAMANYPFGMREESVISCVLGDGIISFTVSES